MPSANQELFDAALRHQVALRRYTSAQLTALREQLDAAAAELAEKLRRGLPDAKSRTRLEALLRDVTAQRQAVISTIHDTAKGDLTQLWAAEAAHEARIVSQAADVTLNTSTIPLDKLASVVEAAPMFGRPLKGWFKELTDRDRERINQAVRLGVINGDTPDDIVRRLIGTRANRYADGLIDATRREAETIARTAISEVSNQARATVWDANEDIIWGLRWTSTLDGRTSPICQSRDGEVSVKPGTEVPPGVKLLDPQQARPPAHPNCRSVMVAVLSPDGPVGERPFVRDARTPDEREADFRRQAKAEAGEEWAGLTEKQRRARVSTLRERWKKENIGQVEAGLTYEQWMRRQPTDFQDATLGPSRAKLFRSGKLTLDDFVDVGGRTKTLSELDSLLERKKPAPPPTKEDKASIAPRANRKALKAVLEHQPKETYDPRFTGTAEQVRAMIEDGQPAIRVSRKNFAKVLQEGRFKNQYETGGSGGMFDPERRKAYENALWDIPEDMPDQERPVYGYMGQPGTTDSATYQYGDVRVYLKRSITERATGSLGDSLNENWDYLRKTADGVKADRPPQGLPFRLTEVDAAVGTFEEEFLKRTLRQRNSSGPYFELQYWGGVRVEDIDEVIFDREPSPELLAELDKRKIPWTK